MDRALECLGTIVKMLEGSDVLQHKHDDALDGMSLLEVHCVDRIGSTEGSNVTKLSESMRVTRGAVSKATKRLQSKGLVTSYQAADNRKEVYFRLTPDGETLYGVHRRIHKGVQDQWVALFSRYSEAEQAAIQRFLTDVSGLFVEDGHKEKEEVALCMSL